MRWRVILEGRRGGEPSREWVFECSTATRAAAMALGKLADEEAHGPSPYREEGWTAEVTVRVSEE